MPPTKQELDLRLARYLDAQDDAERRGATISAVKESLQHVVDWTQTHEKKDDVRHEDLIKRLSELEQDSAAGAVWRKAVDSDIRELKGGTRKAMDSVHDLEQDLTERERDEARASHREITGRVWKVALAVIICIACALVGAALVKLGVHS